MAVEFPLRPIDGKVSILCDLLGYQKGTIGIVGALVIPDGNLRRLRRKFARIRPSLVKEGNEVKGRLLGERDVNRVVRLLVTREGLFEVTALDLGLHTEAGVLAFRQKLVTETRAKLSAFRMSCEEEESSRRWTTSTR